MIKDGTGLSGFVTVKQNQPPRQCDNCKWYEDDTCHHELVMIDDEVPGEHGKPKPVGDLDCCDNFQNGKDLILLILRHGETGLNKEKKFRSLRNVPLNEDGIQQAENAANFLKDYPIKKIVCSPLDRAYHTALFVHEDCGAPVVKDSALLPWNLGDLAGKSKEDNQNLLQYHIDNPDKSLPGGESLEDFRKKQFTAFDKFVAEASPENVLLLVAHTSNLTTLNQWIDDNYTGQPETDDENVKPGGVCALCSDADKDSFELTPIFGVAEKADFGS